jgi:O-antigen/teichoic acid export membrane protein
LKAHFTKFRKEAGGDLGRSLIRSSLGVTGILALDVCLSLAVAIVLARTLGVAGIGIYSVGLAAGRILSALLQLGLPRLLSREVNHGEARGEWSLIRGVAQFALAVGIAVTVVFAIAAYLVWPAIAARLPEAYAPAILAGLFFAPIVALTNICGGGLQGWHKVKTAAASTTALVSGGMLALVTAALVLVPGWLTPGRAVGLSAGSQLLALVFTATLFCAYTIRRTRGAAPSYSIPDWRRSMSRFTAVGGLMIAEGQIFALVLGAFASETQVGLYRIAQRAAGLANLGLMAIERVLAPHVGQCHAHGDGARLQKLVTRSAQAMGGSALVVLVGFAAFGSELLEIAVGAEFRPAYLPLTLLCLGTFLSASLGPLAMLMNMTGNEGAVLRARAVAMLVAIVTAILLMSENAAVGVSIASSLGLLVMALILWRDAHLLLGCRTSALGL